MLINPPRIELFTDCRSPQPLRDTMHVPCQRKRRSRPVQDRLAPRQLKTLRPGVHGFQERSTGRGLDVGELPSFAPLGVSSPAPSLGISEWRRLTRHCSGLATLAAQIAFVTR